jgi:hypothetical protein
MIGAGKAAVIIKIDYTNPVTTASSAGANPAFALVMGEIGFRRDNF